MENKTETRVLCRLKRVSNHWQYTYTQPRHSGCVAFKLESMKLICDRPILDCDPPEFEDLSDDERAECRHREWMPVERTQQILATCTQALLLPLSFDHLVATKLI